ncbi:hypothetical protein RIF29_34536 [Crotalaria pallida]|uniref:F-box domain-containing protein n=1 Tax=Crotalaria pallida TaxID=3830 RepID=A0AAN9EEX5_CROPI
MASTTGDRKPSKWALLPEDLLQEITHRLPKPSDHVRLGAVCKGWHSFARNSYNQKHLLHLYQNIPLLLIPTQNHGWRSLYSVTEGTVYDQLQLHLPSKRCCGSSYGWLFFVDKVKKSTLELILLNPFLGDNVTIRLPPIKFRSEDEIVGWMDDCGIQKAILSKDPYEYPHDYKVVALYGIFAKLAHYKSGDKYWSYARKVNRVVLADVIFYKDLILAVDRFDWIINFTLERVKRRIHSTNCSPWCLKWNTMKKRLPKRARNYVGNAYLVKNSNGDLLLVRRHYWGEDVIQAQEAAERWVAEREREIAEGGGATKWLLHP